MALQSNPSEWQTGESDPGDFTADAVIDVLNDADADEVNRVKEADDRQSVQEAADSRLESLNSGDNGDGDSGDNAAPTAPNYTPDPDAVGEQTSPSSDDDEEEDEEEDWDDPEQVEEGYDPLGDPNVPSSAIAQVIATELEGTGKSPTLGACRTGK